MARNHARITAANGSTSGVHRPTDAAPSPFPPPSRGEGTEEQQAPGAERD